jgi:hypothetical protein
MERLDISDYVRKYLLLIEKTKGWSFNLSLPHDVQQLKDILNLPENTTGKSIRSVADRTYYWNEQLVDFVPSNLGSGKGYLFYFVCNKCEKRVKYLYQYSYCNSPLCRTCCRLKYKAPSRKERSITRLLRQRPMLSSEARYTLAMRAGITKDDLPSLSI